MIKAHEWYNDDNLSLGDNNFDSVVEQNYSNQLENDITHIICQNCGENLYDGDTYYPRLGVCEYCLPDYKEKVEIE